MIVAEDRAPGQTGRVIIWQDGDARQVDLQWGIRPFEPGGRSYTLLRSEGRSILNPCLIVAHEFVGNSNAGKSYRASLITDQTFFCLAGMWQPATANWPAAFVALTVEAYPDLAPYKDRHIGVIRDEEWYDWLQQARPAEELLRPFPAGNFRVTGPATRSRRAAADLFA